MWPIGFLSLIIFLSSAVATATESFSGPGKFDWLYEFRRADIKVDNNHRSGENLSDGQGESQNPGQMAQKLAEESQKVVQAGWISNGMAIQASVRPAEAKDRAVNPVPARENLGAEDNENLTPTLQTGEEAKLQLQASIPPLEPQERAGSWISNPPAVEYPTGVGPEPEKNASDQGDVFHRYQEAFSGLELVDVEETVFAVDNGKDESLGAWVKGTAQGEGFLSTLYRKSPTEFEGQIQSVEFIKKENLIVFEKLFSKPVNLEMGLIFGKVSKDFEGSLVVSEHEDAAIRIGNYFVLINVAPGAHVLELRNQSGEPLGSGMVLVEPGVATDLGTIRATQVKIFGKILDGSETRPKGVLGVAVNAFAERTTVVSDSNGNFTFDGILHLSGLPIYLDLWSEKYSNMSQRHVIVNPKREQIFYIFSDKIINGFADQLEGVKISSTESSVIFGSFMNLDFDAESTNVGELIALKKGQDQLDELYAINRKDELIGRDEFTRSSNRFFGLTASGGLKLLEVYDPRKRRLFLQLLLCSPGVISVVDP
jgi:hypothetical protein